MLSPYRIDYPSEAEVERSAFNAAFYELGLPWHWDDATHERLALDPCRRSRVRRYVEQEHPHLLRAYDAEFLADAVLAAKDRCQRALERCTAGAVPKFNWADARWGQVGI